MKCAIMQPTYLPWSGYFNLALEVDYFIILDDVQFNKRSWQQRNRIASNGQELLLTIPVFTKGKNDQLINEVQINNESNWRKSHLASIEMAYSKSAYKNELMPALKRLYENEETSLLEFNLKFIKLIFELLEIKSEIILSSNLKAEGKKSQYLHEICKELNCTNYLSPQGSKEYIDEEGIFKESEIEVAYQEFHVQEYKQIHSGNFISHLSIIDVIFNIGIEATKKYISHK